MQIPGNNNKLSDRLFGHFNGSEFILNNYRKPDRNDRFLVSFSGTLYNTDELLNQLKTKGFTASDNSTESIIFNLFSDDKLGFAEKLNGNFIISIVDTTERILYLVRDHIGLSRVYFTRQGGRFYFAEELRILFSRLGVTKKEVSSDALNFFFAYRYIPSDLSIYRDINKLDPGSILVYKPESNYLKIRKYWHPGLKDAESLDEQEMSEKLDYLLRRSVARRMRTDSCNCALLSGGLDSSLNVALMKNLGAGKIRTFTIGFEDSKYNETQYSSIVSEYFGTEHYEINAQPDPRAFDEIGKLFEEPNGDPSVFPTYLVSKLVSGRCDSVMCGDGADGLFLGLNTHRILSRYESIYPYLKNLAPALSFISRYIPEEVSWKVFAEGLTPKQLFLRRRTYFTNEQRKRLFKPHILEELGNSLNDPCRYGENILEQYEGTLLDKAGYFTFSSNPHDILVKMERLMGAMGVDITTPFLDKEVVEFSLNHIPANMKIKNGITKYILKEVAGKYLPGTLPLERKRGFNPPAERWIRNEWWEYIRKTILENESDFLNTEYCMQLLDNHKKGYFNASRKIFPVLMFRLWEKNFSNTP